MQQVLTEFLAAKAQSGLSMDSVLVTNSPDREMVSYGKCIDGVDYNVTWFFDKSVGLTTMLCRRFIGNTTERVLEFANYLNATCDCRGVVFLQDDFLSYRTTFKSIGDAKMLLEVESSVYRIVGSIFAGLNF